MGILESDIKPILKKLGVDWFIWLRIRWSGRFLWTR